MTSAPSVSVAIPVFNEELTLPELHRRVGGVLDDLPGGPHEIVFVDDGSSDGTWEYLEALVAIDPRVRAISLSRNFGHQAALSAALDAVSGDVVVVMDGDLQDLPESIPRFLEEWRRGHDVVYAIRVQRKEGLVLRTCYALFYRLIARLSQVQLPIGAGDFSLMSRRVVELLRRQRESHRYIRGLRTWIGFRQIGVPVERDPRFAGESKYGWSKLFRLAFDGIFSFSILPLRAASVFGGVTVLASLAFSCYALYAKLFLSQSPQGFTALLLLMAFLSGTQLLFLGVIGEYLGRVYEEVKRRPLYIVDQDLRNGETAAPLPRGQGNVATRLQPEQV